MILKYIYLAIIVSGYKETYGRSSKKHILVTGAAGFIGFHLARTLTLNYNISVIGIDNFNSYYNVSLKAARAFELNKLGVEIFYDDVCNKQFLRSLFNKYEFTHVIHLSAQAGVRYSLKDPHSYLRQNVECLKILLDQLKVRKSIKYIHASSSSVYGKFGKIPFDESDNVDRPGNMYAASKRSGEILNEHYCRLYGLSIINLRFFTVYGPWGRPDMAVYKFAESMMNHKPIPMFKAEGRKFLARDFTYVDDIVSGIIGAIDYKTKGCKEIFNLGFGKSQRLSNLVTALESSLGIKALINRLPVPPTEILHTWANVTLARIHLNFNPKTNLQNGVRNFVKWYTKWLKEPKSEVVKYYSLLLREKLRRDKYLKLINPTLETLPPKSCLFKSCEAKGGRIFVEVDGLVKFINRKTYNRTLSFFVFKNSYAEGEIVGYIPKLKDNTEALASACEKDKHCIAISSNGLMKGSIQPSTAWKFSPSNLIVFDVDYCSSSPYSCPENSSCTRFGIANYGCKCHEHFIMSGNICIKSLAEDRPIKS
ncbi:DgyrCDS421 [Dimorphilus gyrociliatus]|uniref:DgyrCDS421 n=1 Tax=Dimorphilus gyrociliatus TaxID=2664684 RepID=A0A7I8V4L5_9ANNE|nr:DgyrCDS421 [Dimorphilus gyrociliatus]